MLQKQLLNDEFKDNTITLIAVLLFTGILYLINL